MGSKIHPPIVAVFGKNLAVLEVWDLVTLKLASSSVPVAREKHVVNKMQVHVQPVQQPTGS